MYQTKNNNQEIKKPTKALNLWRDYASPLRYLTKSGIQTMLETAKHGNDTRLQIAFYEMERTMPIYGIVIQRRLAGVQKRKWDIVPFDESAEAEEQAKVVREIFEKSDARNLDGLSEAFRHLTLASFRGRSAVKPFYDEDEGLTFKKIENWNLLEWNNELYWCPEGTDFMPGIKTDNPFPDTVKKIGKHEVAWLKEERPIDIPGIEIYLRQLVGEDGWSRATEKYGVAQVIVTPPEGTPDSALPTWASRAVRIVEGGFGVLPPGTKIDQLTDARGQDPFSKYVEHQTEQIVLLACGSTLGTLAGPTGLGSGLAESQENTFDSLVDYDCKRIANAINESALWKIQKAMGWRELLCKFDFIKESDNSDEILDLALKAKQLGFAINMEKLQKIAPKLSFIEEATSNPQTMKTSDGLAGEEWTPSNAPPEGTDK